MHSNVWDRIAERGGIPWLSRATGYTYMHIWKVKTGLRPATPRFRHAVALALGIPVSEVEAA